MVPSEMLVQLENAGLSRDARLLHIEALVHCVTALTDGVVLMRLSRVSDSPEPDMSAAELVDKGFWHPIDGGYRIVNYLASEGGHQRSAEQVERDRQANRRRQDDYRDRARRHSAGDHSACTKACPAVRNSVSNGVTDSVSNAPLSQSDSALLDAKQREKSREAESDVALGRSTDSPRRIEIAVIRTVDGRAYKIDDNSDQHQFITRLDLPGVCEHCELPEPHFLHDGPWR